MINPYRRLELALFALVAAAMTNLYVTQPVLPVLSVEFGMSASLVSLTVSMSIIGLAVANVPVGVIVDRHRVQPILLIGGMSLAVFGVVAALASELEVLVAARLMQGLAIPALTTCVIAHASRISPPDRLNLLMGGFVAATVLGGLGGRLIGGWVYAPEHWRYAIATAGAIALLAAATAARFLPAHINPRSDAPRSTIRYWTLLRRLPVLRMYAVCSVSFAVFSTIFNYLPFRLAGAPFELDTQATTAMYLPYLVGIIVGPLSGRSSDRFGNGWTIGGGALLMIAAVVATLSASWPVVAFGLLLLCTGFFAIHAAASGAVNGRVVDGKGRANGLYVLFYYSGGFIGIAIGGYIYESASWGAMIVMLVAMLAVPLAIGWWEQRQIR